MMFKRNVKGAPSETGLVVGLGFLLAYTMCSLTGQIERFSGIVHFDAKCFLACGILAVMMISGVRVFQFASSRRILAIASSGLALLWIASSLVAISAEAAGGDLDPLLVFLFGTLGRLACVILTVQWHLHVAICGERRVLRLVSSALVIAVASYIGLCTLDGLAAFGALCAIFVISGGLLIAAEFKLKDAAIAQLDVSEAKDAGEEDDGSKLFIIRAKLFGARMLWGLLFGILLGAVSIFRVPEVATPHSGIIAGILIVFAFAIYANRKFESSPAFSIFAFLPFSLLGVLVLCFFREDAHQYIRLVAAAAFFSWYAQIYFQVPTYRSLLRMNPALFAYTDRLCAFVVFEFIAWGMLSSTPMLGFLSENSDFVWSVALTGTIALFALSIFVMVRHFSEYYPSGLGAPEEPESEDGSPTFSAKVSSIAQKDSLTERETEVFTLLAEGYSRPYIQKRLFISEGTIKTHTRNIYRKLGITNKDDLIELVRKS